jgi:hypothetical protein
MKCTCGGELVKRKNKDGREYQCVKCKAKYAMMGNYEVTKDRVFAGGRNGRDNDR